MFPAPFIIGVAVGAGVTFAIKKIFVDEKQGCIKYLTCKKREVISCIDCKNFEKKDKS